MAALKPQVRLLALVSLLNDSASEMIYPLLPVFLTTVLGATLVTVGVIEGAADGLASILIGTVLFGEIYQNVSPQVAFWVGAGLAVLGAAAVLVVPKRLPS
ncbi:MAG TPA: hypothetical protein VGQ65_18850 [Thermoanaerobaculia bacterium]|jgi:hypothetical protein|nr:hypothetical protein [Thermoanaerobaculia bacterium]